MKTLAEQIEAMAAIVEATEVERTEATTAWREIESKPAWTVHAHWRKRRMERYDRAVHINRLAITLLREMKKANGDLP